MSADRASRRHRGRMAVCAFIAAGALISCSIQEDTAPRVIPQDQRGVLGADLATGDEAAGSNLIFLLAPRDPDEPQHLRSVLRDVPSSPAAVLRSLLAGPNASEQTAQIDTSLPPNLTLNSVRTLGRVSIIDVNEALDELDPVDLRLAVAQLVATATAIEGVDAVQIRIDAEDRVWPRGDGELTSRPLTVYDYPGLVESTQPAYPGISSATP